MFDTVLIANRGEIACRIIATARKLGIHTIAIYSDADANARHVRLADAAYRVGGSPATESYLQIDNVLDVAQKSGAEAIHPGYGFLSENADFAQACVDKGVVFIGPPPDAVRLMGAKDQARRLMNRAGVPVVPGCNDLNIDLKVVLSEARKIGYPVIIKAASGGGGRGMRIVDEELQLPEALKSASRESMAAFANDKLLLEKFIQDPRHIEVQIFVDQHGNAVHMFERDCSIQRRYQKVIEEAPGPTVSDGLRRHLTEAALTAAKAIHYVGAGTVEFIADPADNFYFLEMNTRIQVEHRVTEMLTGQDLVEWQFRIADGEQVPLQQKQITLRGHAIEVRLYAENPARNFVPSPGLVHHLRLPKDKPGLCIDNSLNVGDEVTPYYDPMIAKIIAWGGDRKDALHAIKRALNETQVAGVKTNVQLLSQIVRHPEFRDGNYNTGFIALHQDTLMAQSASASDLVLALGTLFILLKRKEKISGTVVDTKDPYSPWNEEDSWRLNLPAQDVIQLIDGGREIDIEVTFIPGGYHLALPNSSMTVSGALVGESDVEAILGGIQIKGTVALNGHELNLWLYDVNHILKLRDRALALDAVADTVDNLSAPMPGRITQVMVGEGTVVRSGALLMVLEAMKMEHNIIAPSNGKVEKLNFSVGDWVDENTMLLDFSPVI